MEVNKAILILEKLYLDSKAEIIALLKSLQAENKKLKKENEAYKEMWEEFKEYINNDVANNTYDYDILDVTEHYQKQIAGLQKKYLGGGE
jgi:cell shape-determining protein MreC